MDYTTALELILFAVAMGTEAVAVWSLFVSHTDQLVLRRLSQNGIKHITIMARLTRDIARVTCAGVMLIVSLICLHLPPDRDPAATVCKVGLMFTCLFLAVAVISDFRWRSLIDEALEDADRNGRQP